MLCAKRFDLIYMSGGPTWTAAELKPHPIQSPITEMSMLGVGEKLPDFKVQGVKPRFMRHEENGESAFETITNDSFEGKWKVIFFYPKDFTFVCPTEITEF